MSDTHRPFAKGLYAIVDTAVLGTRDPLEFSRVIVAAGAAALQLRSKHLGSGAMVKVATALAQLCRQSSIPFIVNDRVDVAILARADGVHLGQADLDVEDARSLASGSTVRFFGLSCHSLSELREAATARPDYVGFGPVFETKSKDAPDPVVGLDLLSEAVRSTALPVVAIGGITLERSPQVFGTGVHALAMIGELASATSPGVVARRVTEVVGCS